MSYDISIGSFADNITYNVGRLFHDHIGSGDNTGLQALDGLTGAAAYAELERAFARLERTYRTLGDIGIKSKYDAQNGWGSAYGATLFLANLMIACKAHRRHKVRVN